MSFVSFDFLRSHSSHIFRHHHKMSSSRRPLIFSRDFHAGNVQIQPLTLNPGGKGKSAWINMKDNNLFEGEEFRVSFAPKPGMNELKLTSYTKIKLTCQIDTDDDKQARFSTKAQELDNAVVQHFFDKRSQVWPDKAKYFTDVGALMGMYNPIVKEGRMSSNGTAYKPSFSLQLLNCAELVDRLVIESKEKADGSREEQVTDVVWKTIPAKTGEKPNEKLPKFYLWLGTDEDGNDMVTQKVDLRGKDGNPLFNADGSKSRRWVGPQDIKPGCIVRPVFRIQKAYALVSSFGAHLVAEALVIKPAPPKEVAEFENVRVIEEPDPVLAARATATVDSQGEVPDDAPPPDLLDEENEVPAPELHVSLGKSASSAADDGEEEIPKAKKRKNHDDDGTKERRKKKIQSALSDD